MVDSLCLCDQGKAKQFEYEAKDVIRSPAEKSGQRFHVWRRKQLHCGGNIFVMMVWKHLQI